MRSIAKFTIYKIKRTMSQSYYVEEVVSKDELMNQNLNESNLIYVSEQRELINVIDGMITIIQQKYSRSKNYFSASHILPGFSKCERLHGHDYVVKVTIDYQQSDSEFLLDFRDVNSIIQSIIEKLDHKILLPGNSKTINISSIMEDINWLVCIKDKEYSFPKKDVFILEKVDRTTSENLARFFHEQISEKLEEYISQCSELQLKVSIAETAGNEASYLAKIKK